MRDLLALLAHLLAAVGVPASRIILSDLCPNSIVKRIVVGNRRQDDSRQPVKERAPIFCRYVEHPLVEEWTWRRNTESWAECVVVIGKNSVSRCGAGEGHVILSGSRQASDGFQPRELTTLLAGA